MDKMINISKLKAIFDNRHVKYGIPFVATIVIGSFVVREFATVRYEFRKVQSIPREKFFEGMEDKLVDEKELTIEEIYKKMEAKKAWENWDNKRIPRPYDE